MKCSIIINTHYFRVTLLLVASTLLDSVLRNVLLYRQSKVGVYSTHSSSAEDNVHCDNIPWTASDGSRGMRSSIVEEVWDSYQCH